MKRLICVMGLLAFLSFSLSVFAEIPERALEGKPVKVNMAKFKQYIYDYDAHPTKWVYRGDLPCIIDFYADWCAPCRKQNPILEKIAKEYEGKVIIYKVDTEAQRELAAFFGIRSLPTLFFVPMGEDPQAAAGLMEAKEIRTIIERLMKIKPPTPATKI